MILNKFKNKVKLLLKRCEKLNPWYKPLLFVERSYGTSYLAFFQFIQWLFIINLIISIISTVFVLLPQVVYKESKLLPNQTYLDEEFQKVYNIPFIKKEECPVILQNISAISVFNNSYQKQLLLTECCNDDYNDYLQNLTSKENNLDKFFDMIQGTVSV